MILRRLILPVIVFLASFQHQRIIALSPVCCFHLLKPHVRIPLLDTASGCLALPPSPSPLPTTRAKAAELDNGWCLGDAREMGAAVAMDLPHPLTMMGQVMTTRQGSNGSREKALRWRRHMGMDDIFLAKLLLFLGILVGA